jgi:hypothetical protein
MGDASNKINTYGDDDNHSSSLPSINSVKYIYSSSVSPYIN